MVVPCKEALVGFQGLILTWASETRNAFIRLLKNKGFKEDAGRTNRVVRHGFIHDPGIQQEPTGIVPVQPDAPGCPPVSLRGEDCRHQAIARYLAGDHIEEICRELGCSKSWLYKWRDRYQVNDPTWAQEQTRRPKSNPRQTLDTIAEAIIHLYQAWESQGSGRTSVATIWQALMGANRLINTSWLSSYRRVGVLMSLCLCCLH